MGGDFFVYLFVYNFLTIFVVSKAVSFDIHIN